MACLLVGLGGCLGARYGKPDPPPAANEPTAKLLDRLTQERQARGLTAPVLIPDLRTLAFREAAAVARGDKSLATAAHASALGAVQIMGRHIWTFATDCGDLAELHLPPLATKMHDLLVNAAAVPGHGDRTYVLIVIAEPGTSSLRADSMGGGAGGTNPSLEIYAHPASAPGRCGELWPAAPRTAS